MVTNKTLAELIEDSIASFADDGFSIYDITQKCREKYIRENINLIGGFYPLIFLLGDTSPVQEISHSEVKKTIEQNNLLKDYNCSFNGVYRHFSLKKDNPCLTTYKFTTNSNIVSDRSNFLTEKIKKYISNVGIENVTVRKIVNCLKRYKPTRQEVNTSLTSMGYSIENKPACKAKIRK